MPRSLCAHTAPVRSHSQVRLSVEVLESRLALSAIGLILETPLPLASNASSSASLGAQAEEPAAVGTSADAPVETSTPSPRISPRLSLARGLLVSPDASWLVRLRRRREVSAAVLDPAQVDQAIQQSSGTVTSAGTTVGNSGAGSSSLCKVLLDDDVDPIYECPGLDDEYQLPDRPLYRSNSGPLISVSPYIDTWRSYRALVP